MGTHKEFVKLFHFPYEDVVKPWRVAFSGTEEEAKRSCIDQMKLSAHFSSAELLEVREHPVCSFKRNEKDEIVPGPPPTNPYRAELLHAIEELLAKVEKDDPELPKRSAANKALALIQFGNKTKLIDEGEFYKYFEAIRSQIADCPACKAT